MCSELHRLLGRTESRAVLLPVGHCRRLPQATRQRNRLRPSLLPRRPLPRRARATWMRRTRTRLSETWLGKGGWGCWSSAQPDLVKLLHIWQCMRSQVVRVLRASEDCCKTDRHEPIVGNKMLTRKARSCPRDFLMFPYRRPFAQTECVSTRTVQRQKGGCCYAESSRVKAQPRSLSASSKKTNSRNVEPCCLAGRAPMSTSTSRPCTLLERVRLSLSLNCSITTRPPRFYRQTRTNVRV
jgi:hypothetical protein